MNRLAAFCTLLIMMIWCPQDIYAGRTLAGSVGQRFVVSVDESIYVLTSRYMFMLSPSNTTADVTFGLALGSKVIKSVTATSGNLSMHIGMLQSATNISRNTFLLQSTSPISVHAIVGANYSYGALLVLPEAALGQQYYVITYQKAGVKSWMAITAIEDYTQVYMYFPNAVTLDGRTSFNHSLLLKRYYAVIVSANVELTGTYVAANQTIAVFAGGTEHSVITGKPIGHVVEQMLPGEMWGCHYVVIATPASGITSASDVIRVIGSSPNTIVTISHGGNEQDYVLTEPGDWLEAQIASNEVKIISSDKAVMAVKIILTLTTFLPSLNNDACMTLLIPTERWRSSYDFFLPPYGGSHTLVVVTNITYRNFVCQGTTQLNLQTLDAKGYAGIEVTATTAGSYKFSCLDVTKNLACPLVVYLVTKSTYGVVCLPLGLQELELPEDNSVSSALPVHLSTTVDNLADSSLPLTIFSTTSNMEAPSFSAALVSLRNTVVSELSDGLELASSPEDSGSATSIPEDISASTSLELPASTPESMALSMSWTESEGAVSVTIEASSVGTLADTDLYDSSPWTLVERTWESSSPSAVDTMYTRLSEPSSSSFALSATSVAAPFLASSTVPDLSPASLSALPGATTGEHAMTSLSAAMTSLSAAMTSLSAPMTSLSAPMTSLSAPTTSASRTKSLQSLPLSSLSASSYLPEASQTPAKKRLCLCRCAPTRQHSQVSARASVKEAVASLREELSVARGNTSRAIRRRVSASDHRHFSHLMGLAAILILCVVGAAIVLPDIPRLIHDAREALGNLRHRSP